MPKRYLLFLLIPFTTHVRKDSLRTDGAEILLSTWAMGAKAGIATFISTALFNGSYQHTQIRSGATNVDIHGNRIESAPEVIPTTD